MGVVLGGVVEVVGGVGFHVVAVVVEGGGLAVGGGGARVGGYGDGEVVFVFGEGGCWAWEGDGGH